MKIPRLAMFSMSTSKLVEVCLNSVLCFLLWRLRDEHKTPSTENFFEDNRLSGIIICSDSSLLPWKIFTWMLMALHTAAFGFTIVSVDTKSVLLLMCFLIHLFPKGSMKNVIGFSHRFHLIPGPEQI